MELRSRSGEVADPGKPGEPGKSGEPAQEKRTEATIMKEILSIDTECGSTPVLWLTMFRFPRSQLTRRISLLHPSLCSKATMITSGSKSSWETALKAMHARPELLDHSDPRYSVTRSNKPPMCRTPIVPSRPMGCSTGMIWPIGRLAGVSIPSRD